MTHVQYTSHKQAAAHMQPNCYIFNVTYGQHLMKSSVILSPRIFRN